MQNVALSFCHCPAPCLSFLTGRRDPRLLLVAASIMYKTPWYAIAVLMQEIRMLFGRSSDENESSSLSVKRVD